MSKDISRIQILKLNEVVLPRVESTFTGTRWVKYGPQNLFPRRMADYLNFSAVHKDIIKLKKTLTAGKGFVDSQGEPIDLHLNTVQSDFQTLKSLSRDYAMYNGFSIQVLYNKAGKVSEIRHIDFARIRAEFDKYANPKAYWYSRDWDRYTLPRNKPIRIPVFNPNKVVGKDDKGKPGIIEDKQMFYFFEPEPDQDYYPTPVYSPAFKDIEFDFEYGKYKASTMQNGMFPAVHVKVQGDPEDEEKREFKKTMEKEWIGSENAGGIFITYGEGEDGDVTIEPLTIDANADKFIAWEESSHQNIMTAHGLTTPTLAGIAGDGNLSGNANELMIGLEQFQSSVIDEMQKSIEDTLAEILKARDKEVPEFTIADTRPFTVVPDILWEIMTSADIVKVVKEKFGIELDGTSLPNGGEIIGPASDAPVEDVAKKALNGAQIASVVEIVSGVNTNILSPEQAQGILMISIPGMTAEQAEAIIAADTVPEIKPENG